MNTYLLIAQIVILGLVVCYFLGRSGLVKFKPVELSDNYQLGWVNRRIMKPRLGAFRDLTKMRPETDATKNAPKTARQPKKVVPRQTTKIIYVDRPVRGNVNVVCGRPKQVVDEGFLRNCVASLAAIGYKKSEVRGQVEKFLAARPEITDEAVFVTEFLKQARG